MSRKPLKKRRKPYGRIYAMSEGSAETREVQALAKAVEAQMLRSDQIAKTLEQTQVGLSETQKMLEVLIEALKASLNEADRTVDDLSTMVVALQTEVVKLQGIQG